MSNKHQQVIESLEKELTNLTKDQERISIQIETCEDMIHNYKIKQNDNDEKINSIKYVLSML